MATFIDDPGVIPAATKTDALPPDPELAGQECSASEFNSIVTAMRDLRTHALGLAANGGGTGSGSGGGIYPTLTAPLASQFTSWLNQGAAVANDKTARLVVQVPNAYNTIVGRFLLLPVLAAPYTLEAAFSVTGMLNGGAWLAGVCLANDAGKVVQWGLHAGDASTGVDLGRHVWTNPTTYDSSVLYGGKGAEPSTTLAFVRITDDGTTRKLYWSANGRDYTMIRSEASGTDVVPTKAGLAFYYNHGAANAEPIVVSVFHFALKTGVSAQIAD